MGQQIAATVGEREREERRPTFDLEPPIAGHQSFPKRFGGIVGQVDIIDVVGSSSTWFEGPCGLVLANPKPLSFFACRGRLGFFEISRSPGVPMAYLEAQSIFAKLLIYLAPRAGFEPATNRLTAGCSTAELPGNSTSRARNAYNKAGPALKAAKQRKSRWVRLEATPGIEPGYTVLQTVA